MQLILLDWLFAFGFFALVLAIGLSCARRAGRNSSKYFLSGRNMPSIRADASPAQSG